MLRFAAPIRRHECARRRPSASPTPVRIFAQEYRDLHLVMGSSRSCLSQLPVVVGVVSRCSSAFHGTVQLLPGEFDEVIRIRS